jgi:hypothetical protein
LHLSFYVLSDYKSFYKSGMSTKIHYLCSEIICVMKYYSIT